MIGTGAWIGLAEEEPGVEIAPEEDEVEMFILENVKKKLELP